jgi:hypothetical protein
MNAPPSINLTLMAWKLAKWRKYESKGWTFLMTDAPMPRYACAENGKGAYAEHHRIIDRISAGEKP